MHDNGTIAKILPDLCGQHYFINESINEAIIDVVIAAAEPGAARLLAYSREAHGDKLTLLAIVDMIQREKGLRTMGSRIYSRAISFER